MKINKNIEDELEKYFPKGHKERGKALVLVAIFHLELEKQKMNELEWLKKFNLKELKKTEPFILQLIKKRREDLER